MNAAITAALNFIAPPPGANGKTICNTLTVNRPNLTDDRQTKLIHARFQHLRRHGEGVMNGIDSEQVYLAMEILRDLVPALASQMNDGHLRAYLSDILNIAVPAGGNLPTWADIEAALDALPNIRDTAPDAVFLFFASIAKQGNCTTRWCRKRSTAIGSENNREFMLERDDVRQLWDRFGSKIDISEAEWVADWENFGTPGNNNFLIIRNIINQSRYTGFASLKVSTDAYNDFPDLPWAALEIVTGEQVVAACTQIANRPWAGLANDTQGLRTLGRADMFKHTVYTAKKLYKLVFNQDTLDDLKSGTEGLRHKILCDAWVQGYHGGINVPNFPGTVAGAVCGRLT